VGRPSVTILAQAAKIIGSQSGSVE
jgi:hypothetical protein